ncbi:hypothetical protein BDZ89DRAFT_208792 [Hymenopellis radicata]|nr:hypothetical protein BDZ89DRAFT_208792 [Hymenopellis radicata]
MKFGCANLIRTESQEAFCARCMEDGAVDLVSIAKSHARPLPASNLKANPYMRWVKSDLQPVEIDMELGYPEDVIVPPNAPKAMQSQDTTSMPPFTNAPLVRLAPKVSQHARRPDASSGKKRHRLEVPSQGHLLPKPQMPPIPSASTSSTLPPFVGTPARAVPTRRHAQSRNQYPSQPSQSGLKNCSTLGCTGLIHLQSAAKRCTACVMKEWKGKAAKVKAVKEKALAQQAPRPKTPPPVAGPSTIAAPALPSTPLADIIQRAFQMPGSGSPTPTKTPKNQVTADDSTSKQTCSAEKNAHKRVFLRIPSKRKLEEMIDLTRNSSSPSPVKQTPPVEDSAKIDKKPVLVVTPGAIEKPSPAAIPPDEDAMDVDGDAVKTTPPELPSLPPSSKAKGKEKMKAMDLDGVDRDDKPCEISGWDSDLTSLSELERCGDTTDEEDEPASSKTTSKSSRDALSGQGHRIWCSSCGASN